MSGPLSVPFTFLALFVPSTWLKLLFATLAALCAVSSSYLVWKTERKRYLTSEKNLSEFEEKVDIAIEVHGTLVYSRGNVAEHHFFFVPEVTIVNRSPRKKASLGASLWIETVGGQAHCPPEADPVQRWEQSRHSYKNSHLKFPLNLGPQETVSGYIAFSANTLRSLVPDFQTDEASKLPYLPTVIEFKDYLSSPTMTIHKEEVRCFIIRDSTDTSL